MRRVSTRPCPLSKVTCSGGRGLHVEAGNICFEGCLVIFDRKQVMGLFVLHQIPCSFGLRVQGVRCDHPPSQLHRVQQGFDSLHFTSLVRHRHLIHHHSAVVSKSAHQLQRI